MKGKSIFTFFHMNLSSFRKQIPMLFSVYDNIVSTQQQF